MLRKLPPMVLGLMTFITLGIAGAISTGFMVDRYIDQHTAEWGNPATCSITNRGQLLPVATGWSAPIPQREVDLVCPTSTLHAMMLRADSEQPTMRVWHNNRTNAYWIENDADHFNGDDYDLPPTGSAWEFFGGAGSIILAGILGLVAGLSTSFRRETGSEIKAPRRQMPTTA